MNTSDKLGHDVPDRSQPLEEMFEAVFDLAGKIASRISPREVEARLRSTLRMLATPLALLRFPTNSNGTMLTW